MKNYSIGLLLLLSCSLYASDNKKGCKRNTINAYFAFVTQRGIAAKLLYLNWCTPENFPPGLLMMAAIENSFDNKDKPQSKL